MASLGLGWIGEPALASLFEPALAFLPAHLADATAHSIAVAIAFAIITAAGHRVRRAGAEMDRARAAGGDGDLVVKPLELFMRVFWPFIRLVHGTAQARGQRCSACAARGHRAMVHSEEELKMLVTASQEAGVLEEQEEQMLHRVFGFADLTAGQVMIPRTELVAVAADTPLRELLREDRPAASRRACRSTATISTT